MYRKNVAGQTLYFALVNATTGAALTGATVTGKRSIDGAAQGNTTGTISEDAGGQYHIALSQADINGNNIGFLFTATNAIPVSISVVTTAADPTNATTFGLGNLDAAVSTRSTLANPVTVGTNNDKTGYSLSVSPATPSDVLTQVNAALDASNSELTSAPAANGSLRQIIQFIRQYLTFKRTTTSTTETLYKSDNATALATSTVSDDGSTATHGKVS